MKTINVNINNIKVWLSIQPLYFHETNTRKLAQDKGFVCYFTLSLPVYMMEGELIRDERKNPKIFLTEEEIDIYAIKYVKHKLEL